MPDTTNLEVRIVLKDMMSSSMSGISKSLSGLKTLAMSVGAALGLAFSIKGAAHLGKEIIETADQIKKLSVITGLSTTSVQKFGAAAEAAGANFDRFSTAMKILSEHAQKAALGSKDNIDKFVRLGIVVNDANGNLKTGEELMSEFADRIASTSNSTEAMAKAVEMLGKSGEEILPVLKLGSAGIKEIGDAAEKAGFIMSKKTVNDLATMNRQWEQLKTGFMNMIANWLSSTEVTIPKILDALTPFGVKAVEVFGEVKKGLNTVGQYAEALARTIGFWFKAMMKDLEGLFEAFDTFLFQPFIGFAQGVATVLAPALAKSISALRSIVDVAKKAIGSIIDIDPVMKDAAEKTAAAWRIAEADIENFNKTTDATTKESSENLKQWSKNAQHYLNITKDLVNQQKDLERKAQEDAAKTFMGGFTQAIQEFTMRAKSWKDAWLEMFSGMESGITGVLDKFILEGGKMKDFMQDLFKTIERSFVHMLTTMATQALMHQILGMFLGTSSSEAPMVPTVDNRSSGGNGGYESQLMGLMGLTHESGVGNSAGATGNAPVGTGGFMNTSLGGSLTVGGALAGLGVGVAGFGMYQNATHGDHVNVTQSTMGGALTGAAAGAMIGSVVPGIGTVIGGIAGAIVGGVGGYVGGKSAKSKQQKAEAEEERAREEQERLMRAQARKLIMADIRAKYGGGLADVTVMPEIGEIMSHGITDQTLDKIAAASERPNGAAEDAIRNITVGNPQITVNANVNGSYDVQRLAEDLGLQLASSIRSAASGSGV